MHGSIFRFDGQVTVFKPDEGPCYRCLFPQPPPPELAPSCAEAGVLGVLPGIIGSLQANEALKLLLGDRRPADRPARSSSRRSRAASREIKLRRDPSCPVCGEHPTITEYIDYVEFCMGGAGSNGAGESHAARMLADGGDVVTKVRIPPTLRAEVGGVRDVEAAGGTMREVLDDLAARYPGLGAQILNGGDIAPFVNVYLDSEDVRTLQGLDTPVGEDSTVILLPAMAGGHLSRCGARRSSRPSSSS